MKKTLSLLLSFVIAATTIISLPIVSYSAVFNGYTAVKTKEQFFNIRNNPSGKYYLSSDIIFENSDFISHGDYYNNGKHFIAMDTFNGVLDGCGHTISGLVGDYGIVRSNSGTIKNINMDNANLTAEGICGNNYGLVENCKLSNSQVEDGIVGVNDDRGIIRYCSSESSNVGICDENYATIDSCINNSSLSNSNYRMGGIANFSSDLIKNCINNGDISNNYNSFGDTAGICGEDYYGEIYNCTNNGNIYALKGEVVGIAGDRGIVYDSLNTGKITSSHGSLYGVSSNRAINCINIGSVDNGKSEALAETITDCYYLAGSGTSKEGISLTAQQMNNQVSFPILDFKDTWQITDEGISLQSANNRIVGVGIYTLPTKTNYNIGEQLNLDGMLVMSFDNYGNWRITDDYTISGFSSTSLGTKTVRVTIGEASASFNVVVRDTITKAKISLSGIKFTATGKAIKPTVTVIDSTGKILKLNTDYTVLYSANTNPGTATVTITGKGNYTGSVKKTFTIIPMKTTGLKVSTRKTTSLKLTWTKQNGVTGYVVQKYDTKSKKWKNYKTLSSNTNSITASKLTAGTEYKFRVRSYKTIGKTKYYGAYSSTLSTPTSPSKVKIKSCKATFNLDTLDEKYTIKWSKIKNSTGYQIQMYGYDWNGNYSWKTLNTIKGAGKTSYKTKWLKSSAYAKGFSCEKIRIRAYKEVSGKKYYGEWTTVKPKWNYKGYSGGY